MSPFSIFWIFLKLGLTSFGGPVAHLGYFRTEFVSKRRWYSETDYADLVALCQFLPGPASSQVGFAIGYQQGGYIGALMAFLGFTLPSAALMIAIGYGVLTFDGLESGLHAGLLMGLKVVAVAVVAQAVYGMAKSLIVDRYTAAIALLSLVFLLLVPNLYGQFIVITAGAILGYLLCQSGRPEGGKPPATTQKKKSGLLFLLLFILLFIGIPFLSNQTEFNQALFNQAGQGSLMIVDSFFRAGSLVFGGGHVVLPLLQAETVEAGWLSKDHFMAGYGAVQAMPGPLFTFAGYLGSVVTAEALPTGWLGGLVALAAIFLPGFLLVLAFLPSWDRLRQNQMMQKILVGVNAAVVGLLAAAFVDPVFTSGILSLKHAILALIALAALEKMKLPPWLVVILSAMAGWALL